MGVSSDLCRSGLLPNLCGDLCGPITCAAAFVLATALRTCARSGSAQVRTGQAGPVRAQLPPKGSAGPTARSSVTPAIGWADPTDHVRAVRPRFPNAI